LRTNESLIPSVLVLQPGQKVELITRRNLILWSHFDFLFFLSVESIVLFAGLVGTLATTASMWGKIYAGSKTFHALIKEKKEAHQPEVP